MRRLVTILTVVAALAGTGAATAAASTIQLIAPWGNAVYSYGTTDTITLTYSISASSKVSQTAVDAVQQAVDDWATWLGSNAGSGQFTIQPAAPGTKANVAITIKNGGGNILGQTKDSPDRQGFIKSSTVAISGSTFGLANDFATVHQIALHELGHAFIGLGHSDDSGDLMYPTIGALDIGIGTCELAGFDALYPWLTDGLSGTGPTLPGTTSVGC